MSLIIAWRLASGDERAALVAHLAQMYPALVCAVMRNEGKCRREDKCPGTPSTSQTGDA